MWRRRQWGPCGRGRSPQRHRDTEKISKGFVAQPPHFSQRTREMGHPASISLQQSCDERQSVNRLWPIQSGHFSNARRAPHLCRSHWQGGGRYGSLSLGAGSAGGGRRFSPPFLRSFAMPLLIALFDLIMRDREQPSHHPVEFFSFRFVCGHKD